MHEATVTIIENSKPANPKAPHVLRVDTGTGQLKMKAWPNLNPSAWGLGDILDVEYESIGKEWEGKSFTENTIKVARPHLGAARAPNVPALNGSTPVTSDVGPHIGMWEKEAFQALLQGMSSTEIIQKGIEARQVARTIVRTNLDGKLPEPDDFNASLEF